MQSKNTFCRVQIVGENSKTKAPQCRAFEMQWVLLHVFQDEKI
jgi:hypothetical protein